ncbi:trehalose 6-phosphatase [Branchiibius hedensis]|uniref:Trehalose 6-phosphate phosphatase n=1 Tax=Branchiibius hedensis TaxID=672460 RepID=A0A2Y8ZSP3_9MICO|nr:trehalose-phosphatase [Branchiibius hedensis]PWJ26579.1 trehalose 6-phosphatase [Branchiibius hedensis]SSA35391.1 trehalose 6-phosphatase [Branchiibius hedensis]
MSDLTDALQAYAARSPLVVASDFDGVLAPIVADPMAARPLADSMSALRALAGRADVTVALASGRDLSTLRHLTGITEDEPIVLIGSHGAQASDAQLIAAEFDAAAQQRLDAAEALIAAVAARHPGTRIEGKPTGVVLHTRGMPLEQEDAALRDAQEQGATLDDVIVIPGKSILEIQVVDVSKGAALQALSHSRGAAATIYFGDDLTDETAFEALAPDPANVTVKVGEGDTAAGFRVADPPAVTEALTALAAALTH